MYKVNIHRKAKKALERIHPNDQKRIVKALFVLKKNPFSKNIDSKKLVQTKSSYRLRVGNLRVIFEVDRTNKVIYIWEIGYRGKIY